MHAVIELSFGVVSGVGPGIHVLDGSPVPQREGAVSGMVSGIFRHLRHIGFNGQNDVCEKLTIFPYAEYILKICVELTFL